MRVAIGCDEAGFAMKQEIITFLQSCSEVAAVRDVGCLNTNPVLYPDFAAQVAQCIQQGEAERGILICGTGIGMAVSANKFQGIRAAVCHDIYSTERSILSNNAQILCLGARVVATELALRLLERWLKLEFVDGPSTAKIERIQAIEERT